MCKLDPVPKIVEVGGGDIDIDFQLKNDDGSAFSAEGCVIRLSISDWLYRSAALLVYEATLSADSNGIMSVASFHIPGYDTADMSGAYVYQISIKDYLGNYESPIQGKLVLLKNNNPDNTIGGTCGGNSNPPQNDILREQIGDLSKLKTTDKSSLVAAINEAAKSGGNGVYVGSGEMPEDYNIQIDPTGVADMAATQEWTTTQIQTAIQSAINTSWEASY